jgi:hypothetical protein
MESCEPDGALWEQAQVADILRRHVQRTTRGVYDSMEVIAVELGLKDRFYGSWKEEDGPCPPTS